MGVEHLNLINELGNELFVYKWVPSDNTEIKGVVQIAHGMAEWSARYEEFAESLNENGYIVYSNDHRGHGKTAKSSDNIGYIGRDGFNGMVRDLKLVNNLIKQENPDMPVFLFGHSMGSFLVQQYISIWSNDLRGIILSGSNGKRGIDLNFGILIAKLQVAYRGEKAKSKLLDQLSFGSFNRAFNPARTKFDWLSRDKVEVDKYIEDDYCGGVFTASFFYDFFIGLKHLYCDNIIQSVPKNLPVFIMSGDRDPVGGFGKGLKRLRQSYRQIGLQDVSLKLYSEGRHEMLHEINRDEVIKDIVNWLDWHL